MSSVGWSLVFISAGFTVLANLLLRAGVQRAGGFAGGLSDIHVNLLHLFREPVFDTGLFLYAFASVVWFRVLSTEPLSVAYPVLVSSTFALVTLGAALIFHETMSFYKVLGMVVIFSGIVIIAQS